MTSLILAASTRVLFPLLVLFSVYLLLRGHNAPGGGFAGGLVAATAVILYAIAHDPDAARRLIRLRPRTFTALGLLLAGGSGVLSVVGGHPFLTSVWLDADVPLIGHIELGSPLLFDLGVDMVVFGVATTIILALAEE